MAPKKRPRKEEADAGAGPSGSGLSAAAAAVASRALSDLDRRSQAADIARRRAAHFAHFAPADAEDADNVHAGGNNARTLGPWSSAVELVNARNQAQALRNEQLLSKQAAEQAEADGISWEPRKAKTGAPLPVPPAVPPLADICERLLTDYVDCIESLAGVPDVIKVRLAASVCRRRALSRDVSLLFVSGCPADVSLPDCHQLDAAAMGEVLQECTTPRLETLLLGSCGRGFGDAQAAQLGGAGTLQYLTELRLQGAYRLTDAGLQKALAAAPNLTSLSLRQCSLLNGPAIKALPQLVPKLRCLDMTHCRSIPNEVFMAIFPHLPHLEVLRLDGIATVSDEVVVAAAEALPQLQELCISHSQVTDAGIAALAAACPGLRTLVLDECAKLTDAAMQSLADGCKELQVLSIRLCSRLSDAAVAAVAACGSLASLRAGGVVLLGSATAKALAGACGGSLTELDVSFCRGISESALGLVADSCLRLERLRVFGCSQVGRRFVRGHRNERLVEVQGLGTAVEVDV